MLESANGSFVLGYLYQLYCEERSAIEWISENFIALNRTIDQMITSKIADVDYLSQKISADMYENGSDNAKVRLELNEYKKLHPELEIAYVGTETGLMLRSPRPEKEPADYDPRKRDWYIKAMAQN